MAALALGVVVALSARAASSDYFCIEVIDEATARGVPLVELQTTDKSTYITDSNGLIAFNEPGLMNEDVWFSVFSYGYEFPHESFGARGVALKVTPGGKAQLKLKRINIAERLYRVTGRGIYRDTILLGKKAPIEAAALNGRVTGQDTVETAIFNGKLHWFWGDTNRPSHPLGNFFTSGAVSELPGKGGLDPAVGVNLSYFTDPKSGFARAMVNVKQRGSSPAWIGGLLVVTDDTGKERMLANCARVKGLVPYERNLLLYNDQTDAFDEFKPIPLDAPLAPNGHPMRAEVDGQEYWYFPDPFPTVRVKNEWASVTDLSAYEGFTCLKDGSAFSKKNPPIERDASGKLVWKWRKATPPLHLKEIDALIESGAIKADESPFRLRNVDDGKVITIGASSVYWNEYRKKWVMIGVQAGGASYLGEVWFAEANAPEGPWRDAKKIATHARKNANRDFYNAMQHPYFAQEGGNLIYFEGTFTNAFSGSPIPTPNYDYNQLMYRLDLSDPRLKMPDAPPGLSGARPSKLGP